MGFAPQLGVLHTGRRRLCRTSTLPKLPLREMLERVQHQAGYRSAIKKSPLTDNDSNQKKTKLTYLKMTAWIFQGAYHTAIYTWNSFYSWKYFQELGERAL